MRISVIDTLYSRPNDGPAGESYSIDSSADIVVQKVDGSYEPDRIAFHNFVKRGSEERKPHSCACGLVFYNVNGEAFDSFECGVEVNGYDNAAIPSGTAKIECLMFDVPADEYPVTIYQAYKQGLDLGGYKVPTPLAVKTVPVVAEPKPSTRYYMVVSTHTIKKTGSNTYSPSSFNIRRYKQVGDADPVETTETAVRLRRYNGSSLSDIGFMTDGYPHAPSSNTQYWVVDLYLHGNVIQTEYVHIIKDGDTIQGTNAKMPYPAGEYDANTKYEATAYTTPYVVKKGQYYVLLSNESQNIDPEADYAATGGHWQLMEKYKAVWIEMMFANLGKLGSAIFYAQYMFSQYGKDGDTVIDSPDQYNKPVQAGGTFDPNLLINFLTGELKCNNAEIRGVVHATSGEFEGTVKSGLTYSSAHKIIASECELADGVYKYVFDPAVCKCSMLYVHVPQYQLYSIQLPNPADYEGMEISIMNILDYAYDYNRLGFLSVITAGDKIKVQCNISYAEPSAGNGNTDGVMIPVKSLGKLDWETGNLENLSPNMIYKFRAFDGYWWAIEGAFVG